MGYFWRRAQLMAGSLVALLASAGGFTPPALEVYTSGSGNSLAIPSGASQVVIEVWGGGGGGSGGDAGSNGQGAAAGGYSRKTLAINSGHWGHTFAYVVGAVGSAGAAPDGDGGNAVDTTVTNNASAPTVSITNTFGVKGVFGATSTGSTPIGGDTNTQGTTVASGTRPGGAALVGLNSISAGKGGNGGLLNTNGAAGNAGRISLAYT
jgi:hypothetical protein